MKTGPRTNAARILDRLGIPCEIRTYEADEADLSAIGAAGKLGLPPEQVFKTLVARVPQKGVVLACLPGSSELNLKALGAASGEKRAELVPLREVQPLTGYVRGGVSPLGGKRPFPVFLDTAARNWPVISISAGLRGVQILIAPDDFIRATNATLCTLAKNQTP